MQSFEVKNDHCSRHHVLVDILEPDPVYGDSSLGLLKQAMHEGSVVACEVVWAEVATAYDKTAISAWKPH